MAGTTKKTETEVQMPASQSPGLAIEVQGLQKSFNELEVLRGVDLDVARGSIFALLGSMARARPRS